MSIGRISLRLHPEPLSIEDELAFLRSLLVDPRDAKAKLVYADWLEDRGDPRAEYLRLTAKRASATRNARLEELAGSLDPRWLDFVGSLGQPFVHGPKHPKFLDVRTIDRPFTEKIGLRGRLVVFESQFSRDATWDAALPDDIHFLLRLKLGDCSYGASDFPVLPFACELPATSANLRGSDILAALHAKHFRNPHIESLDATHIPYPGYHPESLDEVHNDFHSQYIFKRDEHDDGESTLLNPQDGVHGELLRHVAGEKLWYVLLHPTIRDEFADHAVLFALGRAKSGQRLLGVMTHQVCHNLCD